jgi:hypothetical protein
MDTVAMIYIPIFIKIGSGIQKLIRGYTGTYKFEIAQAHFRKVGSK